jgi:hypothetical protein
MIYIHSSERRRKVENRKKLFQAIIVVREKKRKVHPDVIVLMHTASTANVMFCKLQMHHPE